MHKYNELCCSAHWIYLNQRYHMLYPEVEEHVSEIEKSLYNVAIANQAGSEHIRYHAFIDTQKDEDRFTPVSCCAGLGTRLFGSLPEFLYSVTPDGLYVDIYAGSQITTDRRTGQAPTKSKSRLCYSQEEIQSSWTLPVFCYRPYPENRVQHGP